MAAPAEPPAWLQGGDAPADAWRRFVRHPALARDDLDQVVALVERAERPLVIAGSGVWWSHGERALATFIETTRIPCFTLDLGHGCLPDDHPLCFGRADVIGNARFHVARNADVIVILGNRIDFNISFGDARAFSPDAKIVHVDVDPHNLGKNREVSIGAIGDARVVLEQLSERAARSERDWRETPLVAELRAAARVRAARFDLLATTAADQIHPVQLYEDVAEILEPDAIIGADYGNFGCWIRSIARANQPMQVMRWGMSSLGCSIPWSIAAKLAHPGRQVVDFVGDGAFGFYAIELATACRYNAPVVWIVGNDAAWGYEVVWQKHAYNVENNVACDLGFVRYDKIAEAFGGHGELVTRRDQLQPALRRAIASGKPAVVNVGIQLAQSDHVEQIPTKWGPGPSERSLQHSPGSRRP
jgi:acetolactate synthase-1/2/3 large subunit